MDLAPKDGTEKYPSGFVSAGRLSKNTNDLVVDDNCSSENSDQVPIGFNEPSPEIHKKHLESRDSSGVELTHERETPRTTVDKLRKEICNLYLKIKRCSKDANISES